MSELDRKLHREARRNALPQDNRLCMRVRETSPKKWRESLNWKECQEDLLDYKMGTYFIDQNFGEDVIEQNY